MGQLEGSNKESCESSDKGCMLWCSIGRVLLGFFIGSIGRYLLRSHVISMAMSCGGGCKVPNIRLVWFSMWHSYSYLSHSKVIVYMYVPVCLTIMLRLVVFV